jgi:hypothetical protein
MSKKLEKLKEINETLKHVLDKLEIQMFIDNIYDIKDSVIKNDKPKVSVNLKQ